MRIAVPGYGNRVLPRFGLARLFWVLELNTARQTITDQTPQPWDPVQNPDLPRWLRGLGVTGVLCGGIHQRFRAELEREGIHVNSGHRGEVEKVVRQWLAGEPPADGGNPCSRFRNRERCGRGVFDPLPGEDIRKGG